MVTEFWVQNSGYRILGTEFWLPSIYDDAEKLRFIGILAYPKIKSFLLISIRFKKDNLLIKK